MLMNDDINDVELRAIDLNLLVVFDALMRTRSVRGAAERLHLTPPALSMALARLRDLTEDPLFVRAQRTMAPTPRAEALHAALAPALGQVHAALFDAPAFDPATSEARIRFASPDDLEPFLIPRLLRRLDAEAPGVRLVLRPSDLKHAPEALDRGDADLALTATPPGLQRRHRHEVLYTDEFRVVARAGLLPKRAKLTLARYVAHPHILLSTSGELTGAIDRALAALGAARHVRMTLVRFATFPMVLESSDCVGNMPSVAARLYAARYGLDLRKLPFESPRFDLSLVWHARADQAPLQAWFRALVKAEVLELARG